MTDDRSQRSEVRRQMTEGIEVGRWNAEGGNIEEAAFREGFVDGCYITRSAGGGP
jgi:hypothetical protein